MTKYHEAARKVIEQRLEQSRRLINLSAVVAFALLIALVVPYWDRSIEISDMREQAVIVERLHQKATSLLTELNKLRIDATEGRSTCETATQAIFKARRSVFVKHRETLEQLMLRTNIPRPEIRATMDRITRRADRLGTLLATRSPFDSPFEHNLVLVRPVSACHDLTLRDLYILTRASVDMPELFHATLSRFLENGDYNRLLEDLSEIERVPEDIEPNVISARADRLVDLLYQMQSAQRPLQIGAVPPHDATVSAIIRNEEELRSRLANMEKIQQGRIPVNLPGVPAETEMQYLVFWAPVLALLTIGIAAYRRHDALLIARTIDDDEEKRIARLITNRPVAGFYPEDWPTLLIFAVIIALFWIYGGRMSAWVMSIYVLAALGALAAAIYGHVQERQMVRALQAAIPLQGVVRSRAPVLQPHQR